MEGDEVLGLLFPPQVDAGRKPRELELLQQIGLLEKTGTTFRIPILCREGLSIERGVAPTVPGLPTAAHVPGHGPI